MMNRIGIMQGRLSPPIGDRIQAFPWDTWEEEFPRAASCSFHVLDWIVEAEGWQKNPLMTSEGRQKIARLENAHGVKVIAVCADYFMDLPLIRISGKLLEERLEVLRRLIRCCAEAHISYLQIPFVDNSAIQNAEELSQVVQALSDVLPDAETHRVTLTLETNLAPQPFLELLQRLDHPRARANYDTGNSASLGYDTREELDAYGQYVVTVHVKDRIRGGGTVPLGTGDADFDASFGALAQVGYQGPFILQVARGQEEMEWSMQNVAFVRERLQCAFGKRR